MDTQTTSMENPHTPQSWPSDRAGFVQSIPRSGKGLEIGPYFRPVLTWDTVEYFDVLDQDELIAKAVEEDLPTDNVPVIHHVSPSADMWDIKSEDFDLVFSSHNIEHQPNLIGHLAQVARVLGNRSGGRFFLIIPDMRYCFDALLPRTTLADVVEAHELRRTTHSLRHLIEHRSLTTHNDPVRHWQDDHGSIDPASAAKLANKAVEEYRENPGNYIDVHAWHFTPISFRAVMNQLHHMGMSPFVVEHVGETPYGQLEFVAVLRLA